MNTFEIKDQFYLNGEPFKIISGAIHYFRTLPEYWEDRLQKLKNLGCNTVETYIPWNMHEPVKGQFDWTGEAKWHGMLDIKRFVQMAQEMGLWVILRPTPYICGEWDFGGLPGWLMTEEMSLRTCDPVFMGHVRDYYKELIPLLLPMQITEGGPVLMMQVENEYGSYGNDKTYLRQLRDLMRELGVTVPLFSSDGPQDNMLSNTAIEDVFPTANFGSRADSAFEVLRKYNHGGPCMCAEFWLGWFDAWNEGAHHTTSAEEAAKELAAVLKQASVNLYMFVGGTNFGFMNGSNYYDRLTADVTSYDYDAILTEDGQLTKKYLLCQEVIIDALEAAGQPVPEVIAEIPPRNAAAYVSSECLNKVDLFKALPSISEPVFSTAPQCMEKLGQNYGYTLYSSILETEDNLSKIQLFRTMDRTKVYANKQNILTLRDHELEPAYEIDPPVMGKNIALDILVENEGRVNYGPRMDFQRKGMDGRPQINATFLQNNWNMYTLPMDNLDQLDWTAGCEADLPAFYRFEAQVNAADIQENGLAKDTFLNMTGWGRGCVLVNGFNIGRFWEAGPQVSLYIPGALLKEGANEIIIFETEGKHTEKLCFENEPNLG